MKATLKFIVAAVIGASALVPTPVLAKKSVPPGANAWHDSKMMKNRLHFRLQNGDVVVTKSSFLGKRLSVEIQRGEKLSDPVITDLKGASEVAAPGTTLSGAPETMANLIRLLPRSSSTNGKVNIVMFKGLNGILIVGQLTDVAPAAYFTHFIPEKEGHAILPHSTLAYVLPPDNGGTLGVQENLKVGIILAYADGLKKIERTLSVPLYHVGDNSSPSVATLRPPAAADAPFLGIEVDKGNFLIPANLRGAVSNAAKTESAPGEEVGMERVATVRKKAAELKAELEAQIFGQPVAIERFTKIYEEDQLNGRQKPTVVIFQGVPGSGKSHMAEATAKILGLAYMNIAGNKFGAHAGSLDYHSLLGGNGSPPQEGELISFLKGLGKDQEAFIQIDEGDKMHPDVWKLLMEFLNKGKIKDRHGEEIIRTNITIVVTSNRGARRMFPPAVAGWTDEQILERLHTLNSRMLKDFATQSDGLNDRNVLPDELMSRAREAIPFGPFTLSSARKVVEAAARQTLDLFARQHLVKMIVSADVLKRAILSKWNPRVDAREIFSTTTSFLTNLLTVAEEKLKAKSGEQIDVTLDLSDVRVERYDLQIGERRTTYQEDLPPSTDPLINKAYGDRLAGLEDRMRGRVMGQDAALKFVAKTTKNHAMLREGPNVIGLLGPSGNGKTETARSLAEALYDGHLAIISMGEIGDDGAFETKFGGPASRQGGDQIREFEQALRDNPEGAVIVLDEITNMGGQHPQVRAALLTRLYGVLDIGEYISPIDGRKYDLSKYTFVLTGNALEQAFLNVSSDDVLLANWEQLRGEETIQEELLKMGIPNAFINRVMWNLMKPLLSSEVHAVTMKLWKKSINIFENRYKGLKITTSSTFFDRLSQTFFRASKGGRALRDSLNKNVPGLLFDVIRASGLDAADLRDVEVHIELADNIAKRPYLTDKTPARVVTFDAVVSKNGQRINALSIDVTSEAAEQVLLGKAGAREVSFHEMGHASFDGLTEAQLHALGFNVHRLSEITGEELRYVTIRGGKMGNLKYYGYARSEPIKGAMLNPNHDRAIISMAKLWAGSRAQQLAGYPVDAGWSNDLEKIRSIGVQYLTKWGLDREFIGIGIDKDGNPIIPPTLQGRFAERMEELMKSAEQLADKVVRLRWDFIRSGSAELLRKGEITIERINEIEVNLAAAKANGRLKPNPRREPLGPQANATSGGNQVLRGEPTSCQAIF